MRGNIRTDWRPDRKAAKRRDGKRQQCIDICTKNHFRRIPFTRTGAISAGPGDIMSRYAITEEPLERTVPARVCRGCFASGAKCSTNYSQVKRCENANRRDVC
jgi:hypothetical protein